VTEHWAAETHRQCRGTASHVPHLSDQIPSLIPLYFFGKNPQNILTGGGGGEEEEPPPTTKKFIK